jgi:hypothetical protein
MIDRAVQELSGERDTVNAWGKFFWPADPVGLKYTHGGWIRVHPEDAVVEAIVNRLKSQGIPKSRIHAVDGGIPFPRWSTLLKVPSINVHAHTGIAAAIKNYINFGTNPSQYHDEGSFRGGEIWLRPEVKGGPVDLSGERKPLQEGRVAHHPAGQKHCCGRYPLGTNDPIKIKIVRLGWEKDFYI